MRAILVHGWANTPESNWFPWLRTQLEQRGWSVAAPAMPEPMVPRIGPWVEAVRAAIGTPDTGLVLVGHSIGCQAILRALEQLDAPVAGALLVAGFTLPLTGLESAEEHAVARPWEETPIDGAKVRQNCPRIELLLSDNDPWVPVANGPAIRNQFDALVTVVPGAGHFAARDGYVHMPLALEAVLRLAAQPT